MKKIEFDNEIYSLDALFRAITDLQIQDSVIITKDNENFLLQFNKSIFINEQKIIHEVNTQMVRIQLENKFSHIRNAIVKKALSVNKGVIDD